MNVDGTVSQPALSIDAIVIKTAGLVTLGVGVIGVVISALVGGSLAAFGAVLGVLLVLAFFSVGQFTLGAVLKRNPQMAMTVAMVLYLVKIGVLLLLIMLFADTTAFNTKAFAAVIVACTLAWTGAEVWVFARTKVLYVDPTGAP
jgi:ATP synthase protein I